METEKQSQNQTKIQLSLAALMFFSPLVQNIISKNNFELQEEEINFIHGYIRLGYITLAILAITLLTGISGYRLESSIINGVYTASLFLLVIILTIGAVSIIMDINIVSKNGNIMNMYADENSNLEPTKKIILSYIPGYNIYLRYQKHTFDQPDMLVKESIIARTIFVLLGLCTTPFLTSTFLIMIIIRIASLLGKVDIINPTIKAYINKLFLKNPEEIRGYISGSMTYAYKHITSADKPLLNACIDNEKNNFSLLYNMQTQNNREIKIQYILFICGSIGLIKYTTPNLGERTVLLPILIILGRYAIMFFIRHHLPPLPIYKEITDLGDHLYQKIKSFSHKTKSDKSQS